MRTDARKKFFARLTKVRRGIIVAGQLDSDSDHQAVLSFADRCGWPILPDIQSGLRIGCSHASIIGYTDQLLLSDQRNQRFRTDGVLHVGGRITSKRLLEWLKGQKLKCYHRINSKELRFDPNDQETMFYPGEVTEILDLIGNGFEWTCDEAWRQQWQQANQTVGHTIRETIDADDQLTEPTACRFIGHYLAGENFDDGNRPSLWAASSLPIRMFDMYADPAGKPLNVQANRGASGIDGTIASAAGYAAGSGKPLVLVTGDLAFLHDLNSLALVRRCDVPITIVLLNNDGGNIFSLLPIAKHEDVFGKYFITPHGLTFEAASRQFDIDYMQINSLPAFREAFAERITAGSSSVLELVIDRTAGPAQMREIADQIRGALDDA